jgi:hypothetical protein
MRQDCPECQRLWREYASATTTHVGLESKLRQSEQGSVSFEALTQDVSAAAKVRETTRQSIHEHESAAHDILVDKANLDS